MEILKKNNVMLDLETMGNSSNSAIVAIGAVRFTDTVNSRFYNIVSLESSLKAGLEINADTVMWWLQRDEIARAELSKNSISLALALQKFDTWCGDAPIVWGCGATFDNVILSNAYSKLEIKRPWHYTADMCYRTLKNLYPKIKLVRHGVYHKADDDAESQARHLIEILKEISNVR